VRGPATATFLFDLDGTLIDSIDLIFRCYRHTASVHLSISPPDSVWKAGLGTPLREQLRQVCDDPALIEAMVATYREYHHEHHDASVRAYPEVREALTALSARGARLAVVTSKLRSGAERGLRSTGLLDLFSCVVTAEDVARPKPDPEPVRMALARLGADPSLAVFIGDSPHDIKAGRAAGVRTAGVLWGPFCREELAPSGPDHLFETPSQILSLAP
jgi:pyrophosphatase PpaX